MTDSEDRVLNTTEAAELLRIRPKTLREWVKLGRVPGRKVGKDWRFSRAQLLEFVRTGETVGRDALSH
jgi:excisionase family DNA binding protein